jgi:hypothetical protein
VSYRNICFELKTGTEELMPPIPDSLADRAAALLKCGRNRARDAKGAAQNDHDIQEKYRSASPQRENMYRLDCGVTAEGNSALSRGVSNGPILYTLRKAALA